MVKVYNMDFAGWVVSYESKVKVSQRRISMKYLFQLDGLWSDFRKSDWSLSLLRIIEEISHFHDKSPECRILLWRVAKNNSFPKYFFHFPSPNINLLFLLQTFSSFSSSVFLPSEKNSLKIFSSSKTILSLSKYFPPLPSAFFFSSAKKIFSFSKYFPPLVR